MSPAATLSTIRSSAGDIVITSDIPLADRCIRAGARAPGPKGLEFTEDAMLALANGAGPPPNAPDCRSMSSRRAGRQVRRRSRPR